MRARPDHRSPSDFGANHSSSQPVKPEDLVHAVRTPIEDGEGRQSDAVDTAAFDETFGPDGAAEPELVAEIVEAFLHQAVSDLESLRRAERAGDAKAAAFTAHGLKSSCAHLGAKGMASICFTIERKGKAGESAGLEDLLADLEREFGRVEKALRAKSTVQQQE